MPEEEWDRIFDVNVKGIWLCTKAAAPAMRRAGGGAVVNVTSVAGLKVAGSSMAYAVSKAAAIHLTKCLALALAPEIRVNAVAPGLVVTRWWGHASEEELNQMRASFPLQALDRGGGSGDGGDGVDPERRDDRPDARPGRRAPAAVGADEYGAHRFQVSELSERLAEPSVRARREPNRLPSHALDRPACREEACRAVLQCTVRATDQRDVPTLVQLLEAYMHETFKVAWRGSAEALHRDGFGQEFECQVAVTSDGRAIGFVAWTKSYDLHHCMTGGSILDLYVLPESRGRGVAPALVCAVAAEIRRRGGTYVKGQAVNNRAVQRLYDRFAMGFPGADSIVARQVPCTSR